MNISVMILGMALINLAIRWPVYLFANQFRFPPLIERALAFVPVAVLTAIIVPTVLYPDDKVLDVSWHNPSLLAAIVAAVVGRLTRNLFATIGIGMAAYLLLRWLLPA
ncbi:MAG TPA: AzlD domain-containing protein [Dongiaceae bacterium]|jgi:branched-subunit amino acid transport protein|nr:AzlD domain-containing protein [Dongiaceae bacterium]